jgi:hypothetical protein
MITQSPVPQLVFVQLGSAPCRWLAPNVKAHVASFGGSVFVVSDQVGTLRDAPRWGAEPVGFTPTAETSALLAHMCDRAGFRRGFWSYTAMRFAAIEQLQAQAKDLAIVHVESDVVLNPNLDLSAFGRVGSGIQIARLGFGKVAGAVMFSKSAKDIGRLREFVFDYLEANPGSNEMAGLDEFRRCSGDLVGVLPTAPSPTSPVFRGELDLSTRADLSRLTSEFNGVFDVAGVGQYLFGTDPRNAGGWRWVRRSFDDHYVDPRRIDFGLDSSGWPCVIDDGVARSFLSMHIHSKDLRAFTRDSFNPLLVERLGSASLAPARELDPWALGERLMGKVNRMRGLRG